MRNTLRGIMVNPIVVMLYSPVPRSMRSTTFDKVTDEVKKDGIFSSER